MHGQSLSKPDISGSLDVGFNDETTVKAIVKIFGAYNYVACPHTAIAWLALTNRVEKQGDDDITGVFLSTAHPCKFPDVFPEDVGKAIKVPAPLAGLSKKDKTSTPINADYEMFKKYLIR